MKFESGIYYIWVGGSCDYGHKERAGGGAYIAELNGNILDKFTTAEFNTTEFKMIFAAMDHAIEKFIGSPIVFLSNVQYIQKYEKPQNVAIKILPYHKFPQQSDVHQMASEAMRELRNGLPKD